MNIPELHKKYKKNIHYLILNNEIRIIPTKDQAKIQQEYLPWCIDYYFKNDIKLSNMIEILRTQLHYRTNSCLRYEYFMITTFFTLPLLKLQEEGKKKTTLTEIQKKMVNDELNKWIVKKYQDNNYLMNVPIEQINKQRKILEKNIRNDDGAEGYTFG